MDSLTFSVSADPEFPEDLVSIFRVENSQGQGPWASGLIYKVSCDETNWASPHSGCEMSMPIKEFTIDHIFGCTSIEQLSSWFPHEDTRKCMADLGLELYRYLVHKKDVLMGNYQAAFKYRNFVKVEKWDFVTLRFTNSS